MRSWIFVVTGLFAAQVCAQESVPELVRSSDGAQRVFEERIARPGGAPSVDRIYPMDAVESPPVHPGGTDSLLVSLWQGCDARMEQAVRACMPSPDPVFRFVVERDGRATHGELIGAAACPALVEALHCSMRGLARFKPGRVEGNRVRVRMELPIGNHPPHR